MICYLLLSVIYDLIRILNDLFFSLSFLSLSLISLMFKYFLKHLQFSLYYKKLINNIFFKLNEKKIIFFST